VKEKQKKKKRQDKTRAMQKFIEMVREKKRGKITMRNETQREKDKK